MNKMKRMLTYVSACIFAVAIVTSSQFLFRRPQKAYAALNDEASCISGSGASEVQSVQQACNYCFDSSKSNSARGTLWFNSSSSERNSDVVRVSDPNATTAQIYLWGQTFACGEYPTTSTAWHIWFGGPGQDIDYSTQAVPYLVPNDASTSKYRGSGAGYSYVWLSLEAPQSGWTLKVQEFKTHPNTTKTITASGMERYEATVSVNRCYNKTKNGISQYSSSRSDCYGEDSHIVLEIPPAGGSGFDSKSRVSGDSGTNTSFDWGMNAATLEVEADANGNATVYFSHALRYKNTNPDGKGYGEASTTGTITFDDGSGESYTVPFSAPGDSDNTESGWQTSDTGIEKTISLGSADEKTVCSTITYITKTVNWSNDDPHIAQPVNDSGSTKACAKIVRSETEAVGQIEFWSQSIVESVAANDVKSHTAKTIEKTTGDKVTLRLSTDYPSAKANFSHIISYEMTGLTINANDTVDYTNMCTTWTIESDTSANGKSDKFCASSYYTGSSTVNTTSNHTVSISSPGAEGTAQEKIKYEKKVVPILRKEIKYSCPTLANPNRKCSYNPKRWNYYAEANTGSGSGDSTARIEYVRPDEPDGDGPYSNGAGSADSSPMYAGETAKMVWQAHANPNPAVSETRRVMQYQSIAFVPQVSRQLSGTNTKGTYQNANPRYPNREGKDYDPCSFWSSRLSPLRAAVGSCAQVTSQPNLNKIYPADRGEFNEITVNDAEMMAVPDYVGDKYCNSFGFQFEYFYGVKNSKAGDTFNWTPDGQEYWVHYNAACRTIAKKPSIALWNGGLFVGQGNVTTVTSPRYNSPQVAQASSAASDLRRFGSWTEYLANVNGSVGNSLPGVIPGLPGSTGLFSSGAAFAWNGSTESSAVKNSPLTISNVSESLLGFSGVDSNSALLDRLEAYFKTAATNSESTIGGISGLTDSRIYYVAGDVTINGNIEIASSANSVYQIPQVVIFATGSINITENVDRIDAWLISKDGKVDTCTATNFIDNNTQANVNKSSNPDSRPLQCQKKLVINGPVFAKTITADRSFGSDGISNSDTDSVNTANTRAVPAEVFNLSAENYLWAYAQAGRYSSSYTEAYSRELPPRY